MKLIDWGRGVQFDRPFHFDLGHGAREYRRGRAYQVWVLSVGRRTWVWRIRVRRLAR